LPFCHVRLSAPKPQQKAYPKQLKTLGDHLRKRRLDLGLLQKEVAEQLGVDTASICKWESNDVQPMVHCLPGIIAFLGHNPLPEADDLIGKLKRLRDTQGLTQEKLGQKLGIDESTIAGWERGRERACRCLPQAARRLHHRRWPATCVSGYCLGQKQILREKDYRVTA
jgi:transcriptional regulator with XRE-family HTH domain